MLSEKRQISFQMCDFCSCNLAQQILKISSHMWQIWKFKASCFFSLSNIRSLWIWWWRWRWWCWLWPSGRWQIIHRTGAWRGCRLEAPPYANISCVSCFFCEHLTGFFGKHLMCFSRHVSYANILRVSQKKLFKHFMYSSSHFFYLGYMKSRNEYFLYIFSLWC